MTTYRFFTTENSEDATVVRAVDPYLQGTTMAELVKLELLQIVEETQATEFVLDFANVKMISSSVISSLLGVKRQLAAGNKSVKLAAMSPSLRFVFRSLNMDGTVFDIYDSVAEAVSSHQRPTSYYDIVGRLSPPDEESP